MIKIKAGKMWARILTAWGGGARQVLLSAGGTGLGVPPLKL